MLIPPYKYNDETRLPVPFFSQNDNTPWDGADGNVQCCPTSNAAFAYYLSPKFRAGFAASGLSEPEDYYKAVFESLGGSSGDRGDHDFHTRTLSSLGIKSRWVTTGTDTQIRQSIDQGKPLVAGMHYKSAGHIVLISGYYHGGYLIHDCYGQRNGSDNSYGYINPSEGEVRGRFDRYSYNVLALTLFDGNKTGAWVRFHEN